MRGIFLTLSRRVKWVLYVSGGFRRGCFNIFYGRGHVGNQCLGFTSDPFCGVGIDSGFESRGFACSLKGYD